MSWNYRFIKFDDRIKLCEVYYDDDWRPEGYGLPFVDRVGVGAAEEAATQGILPADVFNLPVEERPVTPRRKTNES